MQLTYCMAEKKDAELLVKIYNLSFYEDYVKYGQCPAYGRSKEMMEKSIENYPKWIIYDEDHPVGAISYQNKGNGEYYIGCLCIIPEYQGKGLGTQVFHTMLNQWTDWKQVDLITPADKTQNIAFYTKKCGMHITKKEMDGNVEVVVLVREKK